MKIVILGGNGFIGSNLAKRLLKSGNRVIILGRSEKSALSGIEYFQYKDSNLDEIKEASLNADAFIHLACNTIPSTSNKNIQDDISSNLLFTIKLLDLIRLCNIKKFIFSSSGGAVYGNPNHLPLRENHPLEPISSYGIHKLAIEKYLDLYRNNYGLNSYVLRIANPYGYGQNIDRGNGLISSIIYKTINEIPVEIWGDGTIIKDYIYIDDLLDVFENLITHETESRIFNIGSGTGTDVNSIIEKITKVINIRANVVYMPAKLTDVQANYLDISRATKELNWTPRVSLEAGILNTYNNYMKFLA